jgi:release factor glutamine methyltransferase
MATVTARAGDRLETAVRTLAAAGIDTARVEAEWLLANALGVGRFDVYLALDRALDEPAALAFESAVRRRAAGEPLQQILGWESFRGLRIRLTPEVLVPRPETEALVEWALAWLPPGRHRVVDVGTGSGCVAAAIADARPDAHVVAIDVAPGAARVARANAVALGFERRVAVVVGDVLDAVRPRSADLIVANPPYLTEAMLRVAPREVRDWEPRIALDGGADGLALIARVVAESTTVLAPGGALVVETGGESQVDAVAGMFHARGYEAVAVQADLTGTRRFVGGRWPGASSAGFAGATAEESKRWGGLEPGSPRGRQPLRSRERRFAPPQLD